MNTNVDISLIILILSAVGSFSAFFASKRGRNPYSWFFIGFVFGILGFVSLFLLPKLSPSGGISTNRAMRNASLEPASTTDSKTSTLSLPSLEQITSYETVANARPALEKQWYYLDSENKRVGPVALYILKQRYADEKVLPATFVWSEGMSDWQQIVDIADLKTTLEF